MVIFTFHKFDMVKLFKSLHNVVVDKNLLPQIKAFEEINIIIFLIQALFEN